MPLIILDRDGVINQDSAQYIKSPEEWQAIPGSLEAIARLTRGGFRVIVASNQSGLARGLFTIDDLNQIHDKMYREVNALGGKIEAIFFCPHGPDDGCLCRKPKPGMFYDIMKRLGVSLGEVPVVGDSIRDLQAAIVVSASPILVRTGKGVDSEQRLRSEGLAGVPVFANLAEVANVILND